ncbi:MAG: hypothetical protein OXU31_01890, partial [Gammaproteobacteria bacterium]|nr:hypothetical protein [Gammaproteobacteria bacterium]
TATGGMVTRAAAMADYTATGTINDDDNLTVSIAAPNPANVDEGNDAVFTVSLSGGASQNPVSVTLAFSGTATGAATTAGNPDYITPSTTFTIPATQTSATLTIPLRHDGRDEGMTDETLIVTISAPTARGVTLGSPTAATANVVNVNTVRTLTVTRAPGESGEVSEGGTVNFRVTLTRDNFMAARTVTWTVTPGQAENSDFNSADLTGTVDFTASDAAGAFRTFSVRTIDDRVNEAAETFTVNVTAPNSLTAVGAAASVTIAASDPLTYAIGADRTVAESAATVTIAVTLSGASASEGGAVMVPFTVGGTASAGSDYTVTESPLEFAVGVDRMEIGITILNDDEYEPSETVILNLGAATTGSSGGSITAGDTSATLTIANDDALRVSIARNGDGSVAEGGTAEFTVTVAGGASTAAVVVPFAIGGEFITAGDYTVVPASPLTIPAGVATGVITVTAVADGLSEAAEVLTVTLGAPSGGGPPVPELGVSSAMATIAADAGGMVSVARLGAGMVDEGDAVRFAVRLSGANAAAVRVRWSAAMEEQTNVDADGERRANGDDAPEFRGGAGDGLTAGGVVTIAARGIVGEFSVVPHHDGRKEDAETIVVTISAPAVGAGGGAVVVDPDGAMARAVVRENEATLRDEGILAEQMTAVVAVLGRAAALVTTSVIRHRLLQRRNDRPALAVAGRDVQTLPEVAKAEATGPWAVNPATRPAVADGKMHGASVESADWGRTAFALPLSEKRLWSVDRAALWGAGATASEEGEVQLSRGLLPYDADASAFHIGADWERADSGVAGFSIGRTSGKARAAQTIGGIEIKNLSESKITSVHPYLLLRLNERTHGWLALGYGAGEVEVNETQLATTRRATADLALTLAAFGAQWWRPANDIHMFDLALRADGMLTRSALQRATFDDGSVLPGVTADTVRLGLEGKAGRTWELLAGTLRAFATAGVRNDFRDARKTTAAAADLGGGMHWQGDNGFVFRLQGAKQALGNGDQHTWGAEAQWTVQCKELNLAPYAQLSSGSETPNWHSGVRLSVRRLNLRLGLGFDNAGADYSQLLRGEVRF